MKKTGELLEKRWFANLVALSGAVIVYLVLIHFSAVTGWLKSVWKFLNPIVIGLILAYLLDPIVVFIEKRIFGKMKREGIRRTLAVLIATLFTLTALGGLSILIIPSTISTTREVIGKSDQLIAQANSVIEKINSSELGISLSWDDVTGIIEQRFGEFFKLVTGNLNSIVSRLTDVGSITLNVLIGIILAMYFLLGKKRLLAGMEKLRRALLAPDKYDEHTDFWHKSHHIVIRYIGCDLLDAVIIGIANAILMIVFQMPYVVFISAVMAVTNLLPTFGPIIGGGIGALLLLIHDPVLALIFLIFTAVLQLLDVYFIKPKLFSTSLGIPAVWTLIGTILGGKMFGVPGVFLAIPVVAILTILYKEHLLPWLRSRHETETGIIEQDDSGSSQIS